MPKAKVIHNAHLLPLTTPEMSPIAKAVDHTQVLVAHAESLMDTNPPEAFTMLKPLADDHCVLAQHLLGLCYFYGLGTPVDKRRAFQLFEKVCEAKGDMPYVAQAHFLMGQCLEDGLFQFTQENPEVENRKRAFGAYNQAARLGYGQAWLRLSRGRATGDLGLPIDYNHAASDLLVAQSCGEPVRKDDVLALLDKMDWPE